MTKEIFLKVKRSLIKHEGYCTYPSVESNEPITKITIGIGYNLTDRGMGHEWIDKQFEQDVNYFYKQLCEFPWYHLLNEDRQVILIDMAFMGWKRFLEFKNMIAALEKRDYFLAASEMIHSKWADEVKERAIVLAHAMTTGVYDV